jgi:microcin C transport system permease protein
MRAKMSPETKHRIKIFLSSKRSIVSLVFFVLMAFAALTAEFISNSKPVVGSINGRIIFPAYTEYNWTDVGKSGAGSVDYREIKADFDWALWPMLSWDPFENDAELVDLMAPPSSSHILGTDVSGRDVFARLIYGTRISFFFGFAVWFLTYLIGTAIGMFQGFFGGRVDMIGQRFVEMFSSIPVFYLLLLVITFVQPNITWLIVINAAFGWVGISLYMRAEALKNRNLVYCEAARSMGASEGRIIFRHILPNSLVPLITFSPFTIVGAITSLSALDLLGFGVPPPTPSWGELLEQARQNFRTAWWLAVFPSLFLFVAVVSLNLLGESLRNAFDPKKS